MPRSDSYTPKRPRVIAAIGRGGTDSEIAREVNCSREYVRSTRADLGLPRSSGSSPGREPIPPAPSGPGTIQADGGTVTAEVASEGRALLTVHEQRHCTAVVRLTRVQLAKVIAELTQVHDQLPVTAPEVVGAEEDGS